MKRLLTAIGDELSTIDNVKYVSQDWGQLQAEQPPVNFPCALYSIQNLNFTNLGNSFRDTPVSQQIGEGSITITVVDSIDFNPSQQADEEQKKYALKIFDIIENIHLSMQGWQPLNTASPLNRSELRKVESRSGIIAYDVEYRCVLNGM